MKKLQNLGKALSRVEQKKIIGGDDYVAPGQCYQCCWNGTTNCSECVVCTSSCTCESGAYINKCSGLC